MAAATRMLAVLAAVLALDGARPSAEASTTFFGKKNRTYRLLDAVALTPPKLFTSQEPSTFRLEGRPLLFTVPPRTLKMKTIGLNVTKGLTGRTWSVIPYTVSPLNTTVHTELPKFLTTAPKLDRAHKNKLLVEASCGQHCKAVVWEYKTASEVAWQRADAEAHSNFPDTFYIRGLRPDTDYVLRVLLRPPHGQPYAGEDVPTVDARTCPEKPPPVGDLHAHSAGPGWLEVRWTPPPKEACKSHLSYQARYAPHGNYFSAWRQYGFFRNERWVHFRPTHPCAVWPGEFCMLVTDNVRPGEQHVIEVRVSRFDELTPALSDPRKVVVRADTACIATDTCGVIGAAPVTVVATVAPNATTAFDNIDVVDADVDLNATASSVVPDDQEVASHHAAQTVGDSSFGRLAPLFLALLVLTCIALPAAFFWGKRCGAREAADLHLVPGWKRRHGGDGGSQPVLTEEVDDEERVFSAGSTLQVDQHGRYSWAKLQRDF